MPGAATKVRQRRALYFRFLAPTHAAYGAAAGFRLVTADDLESSSKTLSAPTAISAKYFPRVRSGAPTTPWLFKRAAEPAISYKFGSEQSRDR